MDRLREPTYAAAAAAIITTVYIWIRARLNGDELSNSDFIKPAFLNAVMVYIIVHLGQNQTIMGPSQKIMTEPF